MSSLGHVLGIYFLSGSLIMGVGLFVRMAWEASGRIPKARGWALWVGIALGLLLWPLVVVMVLSFWSMRRKTMRMERLLGYCEHHTLWEPYCAPCKRRLDEESAKKRRAAFGKDEVQL